MDYDNGFILQKTVDWSLLNDGMTIPVSVCSLFKAWDESILTHGQSKDIKILIDGEFYDAKLKNQNFVQSNWAGHKDVIQIRYSRQSPLAVKLRAVFQESYAYLFAQKQVLGKSKRQETPEEALKREIREELSTEISVDEFLCTVEYDYPKFHLTMHCYLCLLMTDSLHLNEHEAARWLSKDELDSVKWLPADVKVVELLKSRIQ